MAEKIYDPYPWSLRTLVETNFFEVPLYQRPYTWNEQQVRTLLNDLFVGYSSFNPQINDVIFTGTIFLRDLGNGSDGVKKKYEIVDGQQRITTFSMILLCIYYLANKYKIDSNRKDMSDLKSFLWKYSNSDNIYLKAEKLLTLNSIDKTLSEYMFNSAYDDIKGFKRALSKFDCNCRTEKNMINMFNLIYEILVEKFPNENDEIMKFLSFILDKTLFIIIKSSVDRAKVFSVFESINSKGKPLEEIDKIKTYIFSNLNESDYSSYLTKWGQLIVKSDDTLPRFLQIYVKSFLTYYKQTINIINFKKLSRDLISLYKVDSLADALKKLIDDMLDCVDYYKYLFDIEEACKLIGKKQFEMFYKLYSTINYQHPQSIFLRAFYEYSNHLITKDDITKIVKSCTLFLFKFQSINGGDSKDSIGSFERISKRFYNKDHLDSSVIESHFREELIKQGVTKDIIRAKFNTIDIYSKHDLAYSILSLLESIDTDKDNKLLYSQAILMLSSIKNTTFHLDHMLPQNPKTDSKEHKYYSELQANGDTVLRLKEDHDFPADVVIDGMNYDTFKSRILGKIGNIRLYLPELNEVKGNETLHLPEHKDFTSYKQIIDRSSELVDLLFKCPDLN